MNTSLHPVAEHYSRPGLYETIMQLFKDHGITTISRKDLATVDEFHTRGAIVSVELARELNINKNTRILDLGSGLGGPARMLAEEFGCQVTGIDLTDDFVQTANELSKLVGLDHLTRFVQGDATDLPFGNESFDIAWTQHVQMNIKDKEKFYSEIYRVLKPGGKFMFYDYFKIGNKEPDYPVPWAEKPEISFLTTSSHVEEILKKTGFKKERMKDHTEEAIDFMQEALNRMNQNKQQGPGLHLLMGNSIKEKFGNILNGLTSSRLEIQSAIYSK